MRIVILLSVLALVDVVPEAQACSCYPDNRSWGEVAQSDALFLGQLVEVKYSYVVPKAPWLNVPTSLFPAIRPNRLKVIFEAERYWSGSSQRRRVVFTDLSSSSCGLELPRIGSTMLIEAASYRRTLYTTLCTRSMPIYSWGEVSFMASDPDYADYWLLTRDSLQVHLGAGQVPSGAGRRWFIAALFAVAVLLLWRRRSRAAHRTRAE
jgi:hypothetical protein